MALLGWSPGGEQELFDLPGLVDAFDLKGISKSPAVFDLAKLKWMNAEYIKAMQPEAFYLAAEPYLKNAVHRPGIDLQSSMRRWPYLVMRIDHWRSSRWKTGKLPRSDLPSAVTSSLASTVPRPGHQLTGDLEM